MVDFDFHVVFCRLILKQIITCLGFVDFQGVFNIIKNTIKKTKDQCDRLAIANYIS